MDTTRVLHNVYAIAKYLNKATNNLILVLIKGVLHNNKQKRLVR